MSATTKPCCWLHRNALFVLGGAAFVVAAAWWSQSVPVKNEPVVPAAPETVEVWVAAKDLRAGTHLSESRLPEFVIRKSFKKDKLPLDIVVDEKDLLDEQVTQTVRVGEPLIHSLLTKGRTARVPAGMEVFKLYTNCNSSPWYIGPGFKVDLLVTLRKGPKLEGFPLLLNVLFVGSKYEQRSRNDCGGYPEVTLAVTKDQAKLLDMAMRRGCHIDLVSREAQRPLSKDYDIEKVRWIDPDYQSDIVPKRLETAPAPREKGDPN